MSRTLVFAAGLIGAGLLPGASSLRAEEPLAEACRFAEALGDRLHAPDLGLSYLEGVKAARKIPPEQEPTYALSILTLLDIQVRQESDQAKREAVVERARALARPSLDKFAPFPAGQKRPPVFPEDFRTSLAYIRIVQAARRGALDAGKQLKDLHLFSRQVYQRLEGADFPDDPEGVRKTDLMVEVQMTDGATILAMRSAPGMNNADLVQALKDGVEIFEFVRSVYDPPDQSNVVGFPNAYRGLAQCHRGLAEANSDVKELAEARKILNAVLTNPINPNLSAADQNEARYTAAKDLLDIAFKAKSENLVAEAMKTTTDFRKRAGSRPELLARADLLQARVDMENARSSKPSGGTKEVLRAKAIDTATRVKEFGGSVGAEAESLLGEWEGLTGRPNQKNWKQEADKALQAKSYGEAIRKFRAVLKTAKGKDELLSKAWAGIASALMEQQRLLEASLGFARAARAFPSGPKAGDYAYYAVSLLLKGTKELPSSATVLERKEAFLLLANANHPQSPVAEHQLGLILNWERDQEGAERYLQRLKPDYPQYTDALFDLAICRVGILRRLEREGKQAAAALGAAEQSLSAFLERAKGKPELMQKAAEAGYLRVEIHAMAEPAKALGLIEEYPLKYPGAKEQIADLPRLQAIAQASKGDFAAASKSWDQTVQAVGDTKPKPWPLSSSARLLLRLSDARKKDDKDASSLALTLNNQLAERLPFKFSDAAKLFQGNLEQKRYADAIVVGEQILERVPGTPAAEDAGNRKWLAWFNEKLPECYVETGAWAKAVERLSEMQQDAVIRYRLKPQHGELPPALPSALYPLWERTALACTRAAQQMPAGDSRKATASRGADSWMTLLETVNASEPRYWTMLLEAVRSEVFAGRYAAARDRLHGAWLTYPDLGGQKDRFVEVIKELAQKEPEFSAPYAQALIGELAPASE